MYVTENEANVYLNQNVIDLIKADFLATGINKVNICLAYSESYVKDFLRKVYNIEAELIKTGNYRSPILQEIIISIALHELESFFSDLQQDGKKKYFYDKAINDLNLILNGKLAVNLSLASGSPGAVSQYGGTEIPTY